MFSTKPIKNEKKVFELVSQIRENHGCQIILNGIIPTLKYYLRLISSKKDFLMQFLKMIEDDSELHKIHKEKIKAFYKQFFRH